MGFGIRRLLIVALEVAVNGDLQLVTAQVPDWEKYTTETMSIASASWTRLAIVGIPNILESKLPY